MIADCIRHSVRNLASCLPLIRLVPRPERPPGLSAIVRVKNEETWLKLSIMSILGFADEIIIGDNGSTDSSPTIIKRLQHKYPDKISVLNSPHTGIRDLTNTLIDQTHYKWILRWDADFVARTQADGSISEFKNWLQTLHRKRYYLIYPSMVELSGDLYHQRPEIPVRGDCHCFTYSPRMRYVYDPNGYEAPKAPKWYKVKRYKSPTFFHVDVKPVNRMFLSYLWKRFLLSPKEDTEPNYQEFIRRVLQEEWGGKSLENAGMEWALKRFSTLIPYDHERFGEYPSIMKDHLENPQYRLRYTDGIITSRDEG